MALSTGLLHRPQLSWSHDVRRCPPRDPMEYGQSKSWGLQIWGSVDVSIFPHGPWVNLLLGIIFPGQIKSQKFIYLRRFSGLWNLAWTPAMSQQTITVLSLHATHVQRQPLQRWFVRLSNLKSKLSKLSELTMMAPKGSLLGLSLEKALLTSCG